MKPPEAIPSGIPSNRPAGAAAKDLGMSESVGIVREGPGILRSGPDSEPDYRLIGRRVNYRLRTGFRPTEDVWMDYLAFEFGDAQRVALAITFRTEGW